MISRLIDLCLAFTLSVFVSPLLLLVAAAVKMTSPGPVFYRGLRVGLAGMPFEILKFRTMRYDASGGPQITRSSDPRITAIGRMLRRYKLDELPQLVNVLKGDMALVGPRPEDPKYVALYTVEQRKILDVRPGITSPASIAFRREEALLTGDDWERRYTETIMPAKLNMDLAYLKSRTVGSDIRVLWRTVVSLLWR